MCYESDARPPRYGEPVTGVRTGPVVVTGGDGQRIGGFRAVPERVSGVSVLVLPDNRGMSAFYERVTERLAEQGHPSLAIDYFARTAGTGYRERGAGFDSMPHLARLTRPGLYDDWTAAIAELRARQPGPVVSLGFCMGGRFAFGTALRRFGLAGVIGFYGYPDRLRDADGPTQLAAGMTGPVLGLFGGADDGITPETIGRFGDALSTAGVEHEFVTYPGAPHGFFDGDRPDFEDESRDAWRRVLAFLRARASAPVD
jgi:carboxymethylenebutenolidase